MLLGKKVGDAPCEFLASVSPVQMKALLDYESKGTKLKCTSKYLEQYESCSKMLKC